MKKRILITFALLVILALSIALPVFGSNITAAIFRGVITVSNNGTAETNVATVFTGNTMAWIANEIMDSSFNNTAIRSSSGADLAYMPGYGPDGNPWALWVPAIGANTYLTDLLFTGGPDDMDGQIRYFPGAGGMTTPDDNADLEPSANFTIEQKGWVDTVSL